MSTGILLVVTGTVVLCWTKLQAVVLRSTAILRVLRVRMTIRTQNHFAISADENTVLAHPSAGDTIFIISIILIIIIMFVLPIAAVRRFVVITFLVLFASLLQTTDASKDSPIVESTTDRTTTCSTGSSCSSDHVLASHHQQQQQQQQQHHHQQQQQQCLQLQMALPPIGNFQLNDGALQVLESGYPYEVCVVLHLYYRSRSVYFPSYYYCDSTTFTLY